MRRVRIVLSGIALSFLAFTASAAPHPFYAQMLQRGVTSVQRGRYVEAVKELRTAAFGLMDEIAMYQTAQVHLAVAHDRLGKAEDARLAAAKFVQSERIAPRYATLTIDPATRTAFEKVVASAVEPEYLAQIPAFRRAAPAPVSAVASTAAPVLPAPKKETPVVTPEPKREPVVTQQPVQQPQVQQPVMQQPVRQQPVLQQPVQQKSQPQIAQPLVQKPAPQVQVKIDSPKPTAPPVTMAPKPAVVLPVAGLREAQQLLNEGKLLAAREAFTRLSVRTDLQRADLLEIGKGLNRTGAWQESAFVYQKAQPFQAREEQHMFYEAVNRYELGELMVARSLLTRSVASLPQTREVTMYRSKIEAGL